MQNAISKNPLGIFPSRQAVRTGCNPIAENAKARQTGRPHCVENAGGGGKIPQLNKVSKIDPNNPLSGFTPRELMRELYNRGYIGELTFSQKIDISKL